MTKSNLIKYKNSISRQAGSALEKSLNKLNPDLQPDDPLSIYLSDTVINGGQKSNSKIS